jgi:hypothetical protein
MKRFKSVMAVFALMVMAVALSVPSLWTMFFVNIKMAAYPEHIRYFCAAIAGCGEMVGLVWVFYKPIKWLCEQAYDAERHIEEGFVNEHERGGFSQK